MPLTSDSARLPAVPPAGADDTPIRSREEFCLALKAARERRGVTLHDIAEATKVCPSHLAALERADLQRWPKGLYRRTFFRGYVEKIGLPVAETLNEFVTLFQDEEGAQGARGAQGAQGAQGVRGAHGATGANAPRLLLDSSWHAPKAPFGERLVAAVVDGAVVMLAAVGVAWAGSWAVSVSAAVMAMSYFTLATVVLGDSAAACGWRWYRRWASLPREAPAEERPAAEGPLVMRTWNRFLVAMAQAFDWADDGTADGYRIGEERPWTTDARRVRPDGVPPRLRVRFKWSD